MTPKHPDMTAMYDQKTVIAALSGDLKNMGSHIPPLLAV